MPLVFEDKAQAIVIDYLNAYEERHGCWPTMEFPDDDQTRVLIKHHRSVFADDDFIIADIYEDLPVWADNLRSRADTIGLDALILRLAPVNIREVFAYELSASERR